MLKLAPSSTYLTSTAQAPHIFQPRPWHNNPLHGRQVRALPVSDPHPCSNSMRWSLRVLEMETACGEAYPEKSWTGSLGRWTKWTSMWSATALGGEAPKKWCCFGCQQLEEFRHSCCFKCSGTCMLFLNAWYFFAPHCTSVSTLERVMRTRHHLPALEHRCTCHSVAVAAKAEEWQGSPYPAMHPWIACPYESCQDCHPQRPLGLSTLSSRCVPTTSRVHL